MTRHVILVTGPPCAGKTTYVHTHAHPDDLVLDQDELGAREMNRALQRVRKMRDGTAWVIRTCPGQQRRDHLAKNIRATDTVVLTPPHDVLYARAKKRPGGVKKTLAAIRKWHGVEANNPPPIEKTWGGAKRKAPARSRGYDHNHDRLRQALLPAAYGQPCHHCGETMQRGQPLDLDHTPDRTSYRGMAHASCNRRDGVVKANRSRQQRGTSRAW